MDRQFPQMSLHLRHASWSEPQTSQVSFAGSGRGGWLIADGSRARVGSTALVGLGSLAMAQDRTPQPGVLEPRPCRLHVTEGVVRG